MRRLIIVFLVMALVAAFAFLAWIPSAKEPGYRFLLAWGEKGSGPGELDGPIGIALLGEEVFVSDSGNHRIQVFDRQGNFLRSLGKEGDGPGELGRPMHVDARDGRLYVAEYRNDRIQVFAAGGRSLSMIGRSGSGLGEFDAPAGVAVDSQDRLYVADF